MNTAQKCVDNLIEVLQSIAKLNGKVIQVYTQEELMDKTKQLTLPAAGVIYEGMRSVQKGETGAAIQMGMATEIILSIVVIETNANVHGSAGTKALSTELLDTLRHKIARTRSPTNHFWKFVVEAPAVPKSGVVVWMQRWTSPCTL